MVGTQGALVVFIVGKTHGVDRRVMVIEVVDDRLGVESELAFNMEIESYLNFNHVAELGTCKMIGRLIPCQSAMSVGIVKVASV